MGLAFMKGMKDKKHKNLELTKEKFIVPLVRRRPAFEQPRMELPVPSYPDRGRREDEKTKEIELRGVWTIEI
jgi:hypothetical protein